jgi:Bromodomain
LLKPYVSCIEAEPDVDEQGNLEHHNINGLPVHTVIGLSPIEAWGKVLSKLGLTDEIMSVAALDSIVSTRNQGLVQAKGKIERQQARRRGGSEHSDPDATIGSGDANGLGRTAGNYHTMPEGEIDMKVASLRSELDEAKCQDRAAGIELAEKRISALGAYLSNPFADNDPQLPQQSNWLALAVRKEKTKMGSTGNKKKIVTATDLLERNDTFYNAEIENLIEGLPGSEYCTSYIFQSMRSGGVAASNRNWVHEVEARREKERERREKATMEKKVKDMQLEEKETKRKALCDVRDERKRQKIEEEEEKKKARIDERLARLDVQVDDRLYKEGCFQREKAIVLLAKSFIREYTRRRRAAEIVAAQSIWDSKRRDRVTRAKYLPLPKDSRVYDEDVLRVWDFVSSFGAFFVQKGYIESLPTMDSLQSAIDTLRGTGEYGNSSKDSATSSLTDIAVALCKPLAASQTRLLFASLIALYPVLQKEFGAAFFNEINEVGETKSSEKMDVKVKDKDDIFQLDLLLPVNSMTWQEIARMAFLSDALGELGYSRQDSAHLLRGYRSAGHPNSKEARRLRRVEDYAVALLRQALADGTQAFIQRRPNTIRIEIPTAPSCLRIDWIYYVHNLRYLKPGELACFKRNTEKALSLLKECATGVGSFPGAVSVLEGCLELLGSLDSPSPKSPAEVNAFKKAKQRVVDFLDNLPDDGPKKGDLKAKDETLESLTPIKPFTGVLNRQQMGLIGSLTITKQEYKRLVHTREEYMQEAMQLKEDMERQKRKERKEAGEEDDDDDDDEEEEDDDDDDRLAKNGKRGVVITTASDVAAAVVAADDNKPDAVLDEKVADAKMAEADSQNPLTGNSYENEKGEASEDQVKPGAADEQGDGSPKHEMIAEAVAKTEQQVEPMEVDSDANANKDDLRSNDATADKSAEKVDPVKREDNGSSKRSHCEESVGSSEPMKIGRPSQYDDFCGDIPTAPELVRRCLAVLRSLTLSGPAEPFIYPVDPQTNPGYYDMVLRPMCLWKAGKELQAANKRLSSPSAEDVDLLKPSGEVDDIVQAFGQNIRLIAYNCHSYANAGPMVVSAGGELLRIFERLFLDWVLAPTNLLTPLDELDDDKCVEHHASDEDSTVLLCDGCEGNFNISRLDPPLKVVPKGDWYCPRCISGRWWGHLDPRIGMTLNNADGSAAGSQSLEKGVIRKCIFQYPEDGSAPRLCYEVKKSDGTSEPWTLDEVDKCLLASGKSVPRVRCIAALAESHGYGCNLPDKNVARELVPIPLNPNMSDAAAQAALSSTVFRDTINASGTLLLINPEEMKAGEWLRLLLLLIMKCSSSDIMQNLASKLESEAAEAMAKHIETLGKVSDIAEILEEVEDDEECGEEPDEGTTEDNGENGETLVEKMEVDALNETQGDDDKPPTMATEKRASTVEVDPTAVEVMSSTPGDPNQDGTGPTQESKEVVLVDPIQERSAAVLAEKTRRAKAREDGIAAFTMKLQLRPTAASFQEDGVSHVIDAALGSQESGLTFAATRCRNATCDFCGLTDIALGTPLMRVPDDNEWDEIIPHTSRSRRVNLVARLQGKGISEDSAAMEVDEETETTSEKRSVSLKIRIGDDLISVREKEDIFDRTVDGGMLEFCPRNHEGFQDEMDFRSESGLPFITGSLSAHECCAVAAHKARRAHSVQRFKTRQLELADASAGMTCGRTLALGQDAMNRLYWKFHKEPDVLLVFTPIEDTASGEGKWQRLSEPETIASVIIGLGKDPVVKELKRAYPRAAAMIKDGSWSNAILKRRFPNALKASNQGDEAFSDVDIKPAAEDYEDEELVSSCL